MGGMNLVSLPLQFWTAMTAAQDAIKKVEGAAQENIAAAGAGSSATPPVTQVAKVRSVAGGRPERRHCRGH